MKWRTTLWNLSTIYLYIYVNVYYFINHYFVDFQQSLLSEQINTLCDIHDECSVQINFFNQNTQIKYSALSTNKEKKSYVFMDGATVCGLFSVGFCLWNINKKYFTVCCSHNIEFSLY